ncbi:hypothetical protein [Labilibaculum euxinus]
MSWNLGTIYNFDGSLNIAGPSYEDLYIEEPTGNWVRKSDLQKDVVARYVSKDAYTSVGAQRYYKGSSLHLVREPYSLVTMRENASSGGDDNYQDGDIVGYGWSFGGVVSVIGGGGVKYYDLWDKHGGHKAFEVPFGSIGVDISAEVNFVWITSVNGKDFHVNDFSGSSTAMNESILFGGYSMTTTDNYFMQEVGATWGVLPFSVTITPGIATPFKKVKLDNSITNNYLRTGGIH